MKLKIREAVTPIKLIVLNTSSISESNSVLKKNSCKKGCYFCCFRLIKITIAEAIIIHQHLVKTKKWDEVHDRIKEQRPISIDIDPLAWVKMRIECPILDPDKKICLAYKVRPPICSVHFVESDPEVCDPWYSGEKIYEPSFEKELYERAVKRIDESTEALLSMVLPIQSALLFAEKISMELGLSYEQVIRIISNEF